MNKRPDNRVYAGDNIPTSDNSGIDFARVPIDIFPRTCS